MEMISRRGIVIPLGRHRPCVNWGQSEKARNVSPAGAGFVLIAIDYIPRAFALGYKLSPRCGAKKMKIIIVHFPSAHADG